MHKTTDILTVVYDALELAKSKDDSELQKHAESLLSYTVIRLRKRHVTLPAVITKSFNELQGKLK